MQYEIAMDWEEQVLQWIGNDTQYKNFKFFVELEVELIICKAEIGQDVWLLVEWQTRDAKWKELNVRVRRNAFEVVRERNMLK